MASVSLEPTDYFPPPAFGGPSAFFFCILVLGIGVACAILYMILHARTLLLAERRTQTEILESAARPLSPGPRRVVGGRVDVDATDGVAVELDIEQYVVDVSNKNGCYHEWRESDRKLRALPFYLLQDGGDPVYVEPGNDVFVVDTIENRYPDDMPRFRIRAADVRRGEEFYVYGDLHLGPHPRARTAYRDGGTGWVLRAPQRGPMLMASEIIRDRYRSRISFLRSSAYVAGVLFVVTHGLCTAPYLVASFFGRHTTADVADTHHWATRDKHNAIIQHYSLHVVTDDGLSIEQEVGREAYFRVSSVRDRGDTAVVPILRTSWSAATYIGEEAYVSVLFPILGGIFASLGLLLVYGVYQQQIPWYDRRKLVEHGGPGKWIESRPGAPVDPRAN
jgi:hypothetical protein